MKNNFLNTEDSKVTIKLFTIVSVFQIFMIVFMSFLYWQITSHSLLHFIILNIIVIHTAIAPPMSLLTFILKSKLISFYLQYVTPFIWCTFIISLFY